MAYRTLRELEAEGLVTSSWVLDAAPRRVYQLTPEGRLALRDWTGVMRERERLVATFLEQVSAIEPDKGAQT
jgi:DNA-binding PadR family transcriptional regulator